MRMAMRQAATAFVLILRSALVFPVVSHPGGVVNCNPISSISWPARANSHHPHHQSSKVSCQIHFYLAPLTNDTSQMIHLLHFATSLYFFLLFCFYYFSFYYTLSLPLVSANLALRLLRVYFIKFVL